MAVQATAVWRVRPSGSNTNGGGYDPGIAGAATDYSQQNAAQATGSNLTGTTATVTDLTANNFTSAMVGNAMYITGGGATTGWYFIITFTSSSVVALDRSPGAGVTNATWALGGGWANFWTNGASTQALVPGNTVFILGSGTPNPSSYTYDYTVSTLTTFVNGSTSTGRITFANDPSTPGYKAPPDTTGGMPTVRVTGPGTGTFTVNLHNFSGLWIVAGTGLVAGNQIFGQAVSGVTQSFALFGCVYDQFGLDVFLTGQGPASFIGCEAFSSVVGTPSTNAAIYVDGAIGTAALSYIIGCNIHDTVACGIVIGGAATPVTINNNIIAKCGNEGIRFASGGSVRHTSIINNTIDGNGGNGILMNQSDLCLATIINNIISNHTVAGKAGVSIASGAAAVNTTLPVLCDYNVYYNNTADVTNINYGPHDTHGGSNPYVGQPTENFTLA